MVGNAIWDFPGRKVHDRSRKVTTVRAWWPRKTNKGWRWLVLVNRVSTIELTNNNRFFEFFGVYTSVDIEVIRYESSS